MNVNSCRGDLNLLTDTSAVMGARLKDLTNSFQTIKDMSDDFVKA